MKIVCENCNAKYSISDEKVKGKVFKIRCKKCGESIVVRGDAQKAEEPQEKPAPAVAAPPAMPSQPDMDDEGEVATRVFDYSGFRDQVGDNAIWHIVVDGQQQGPYTKAQLVEYLEAGSLTEETFIWREGYDDWIPLKEAPEFQPSDEALADSAGEPAPSGDLFEEPPAYGGGGLFDQADQSGEALFGSGSGREEAASPFEAGGGIFGSPDASATGEVFSSAPSAPATGGLFSAEATGQKTEEGGGLFSDPDRSAGGDLFSNTGEHGGSAGQGFASTGNAAPSPRVSAEAMMMTGQRNENSVLFSLSNLQALASGAQTEAETGGGFSLGGLGSGDGGGAAAGAVPAAAPAEEASGLIDIRALASSISTEQESNVDDLISMGGGGFAPALGAPVLAPTPEGMSTGLKIAIAAGGVALLAAIVVIAVFFIQGSRDDADQEAAKARMAELEEKLRKLEEQEKSAVSDADKERIQREQAAMQQQIAAETKTSGVQPTKVASKTTSRTASSASTKRSGSSSSKSTSSRPSSSTSSSSSSKKSSTSSRSKRSGGSDLLKPETNTTPKKSSTSDLDDLLGSPAAKKKKKEPAPAATGGSLPANLNRGQVQGGMGKVAGAVKRCGQGQGGTITMNVTIAKTGRVTSANATGVHAGTPIGFCAARAVRKARFPKFSGADLKVKYPFKL